MELVRELTALALAKKRQNEIHEAKEKEKRYQLQQLDECLETRRQHDRDLWLKRPVPVIHTRSEMLKIISSSQLPETFTIIDSNDNPIMMYQNQCYVCPFGPSAKSDRPSSAESVISKFRELVTNDIAPAASTDAFLNDQFVPGDRVLLSVMQSKSNWQKRFTKSEKGVKHGRPNTVLSCSSLMA